jgi:hypothetical protein
METRVPDEIIPGVYQHYKGPKYLVQGVARHANTEERGVVYMPLEPHGDELPQLSWRPVDGVDGFFTPIQIDGEWKERFTFLYPVHSTKVERQKMK